MSNINVRVVTIPDTATVTLGVTEIEDLIATKVREAERRAKNQVIYSLWVYQGGYEAPTPARLSLMEGLDDEMRSKLTQVLLNLRLEQRA